MNAKRRHSYASSQQHSFSFLEQQSKAKPIKRKGGYIEYSLMSEALFQTFEILDIWVEDCIGFSTEYGFQDVDPLSTLSTFHPVIMANICAAKKWSELQNIDFKLSINGAQSDEDRVGNYRPNFNFQKSHEKYSQIFDQA